MARKLDKRVVQAKDMFLNGMKLVEIASQLNLPEGTVRRWKSTYKWDSERSNGKSERSKRKRGAQPGNKNSAGGPPGNKKAEKYGFFSKYLPPETQEIFTAIEQSDPLDLLWHQIQLAYAAIIRAQSIMYVEKRRYLEEDGDVQIAMDRQSNFLNAQARAQGELCRMIKQYDDMLHKNWEMATEEQKARIEQMKANTERMLSESSTELDEGVVIINDAPTG